MAIDVVYDKNKEQVVVDKVTRTMFQFGAKIRGEEMIGFPIKFPIW